MDTEKKEKKQSAASNLFDIIEIFAVSIVAVLLIFTFLGKLSSVNGPSMQKTLEAGDKLVISNLFYTPKTGDIIVFQQRGGAHDEPLVKRVIATGGQTVKINFDSWSVWVDGKMLDESAYVNYAYETKLLPDGTYGQTLAKMINESSYKKTYAEYLSEDGTMTVPEGYVFVMGDNRNNSSDSRSEGIGFVSVNDIMGHVIIRLFPFGKFGAVK